jgi:hypothetical protein
MAPVLAELLHIFAGIGGGNAGRGDWHTDSIVRCSIRLGAPNGAAQARGAGGRFNPNFCSTQRQALEAGKAEPLAAIRRPS